MTELKESLLIAVALAVVALEKHNPDSSEFSDLRHLLYEGDTRENVAKALASAECLLNPGDDHAIILGRYGLKPERRQTPLRLVGS